MGASHRHPCLRESSSGMPPGRPQCHISTSVGRISAKRIRHTGPTATKKAVVPALHHPSSRSCDGRWRYRLPTLRFKLVIGTEGRSGVHCSRTVERGTRDSSPHGWVYGVSGNSAPHSGPDSTLPIKRATTKPGAIFAKTEDKHPKRQVSVFEDRHRGYRNLH